MIKLYNTLTRQLEEFKPLRPPLVTVYTCGPTVYDYPHIGNWFTFIRYDLLIRTLKAEGYKPRWVMNITDVGHLVSDSDEGEDKLQLQARKKHKTAWDIAEFFTGYFVNGLSRLNILLPDCLPKATNHIADQIKLIKILEKKGFTYSIEDGLYFDTSKFSKYADFAQLDLDEQQASARIELNKHKRHFSDFALWKYSPKDTQRDMEWPSPWGTGFPGWHIECSAMSMKYLGETLDVHSGGIDHIPIHHTNEIAQSESATGKTYARYWMHTNHILVKGKKISKSLKNSITLEDIEAKGYSLEALRLLILESHYRTQSVFSWEALEAASNRLQEYRAMAVLRWQPQYGIKDVPTFSYNDVESELRSIMSNDLDTPGAVAFLSRVTTQINQVLLAIESIDHFVAMIDGIDRILGLELGNLKDITHEQKMILRKREDARKSQAWDLADNLRQILLEQSIGVRDTQAGQIWYPL